MYLYISLLVYVYLCMFVSYVVCVYLCMFVCFFAPPPPRRSGVPAFSYTRVRERGAGPKTVPEAEVEKVSADCRVATREGKRDRRWVKP